MLIPLFLLCVGSLFEGIKGEEADEAPPADQSENTGKKCGCGGGKTDDRTVEKLLIGFLGAMGVISSIGFIALCFWKYRASRYAKVPR